MKANPNYWGGKVSIGSVKIETIPSEQSIASAVEANTVQTRAVDRASGGHPPALVA